MPRYGLVIDLERCIGCHTCTVACKHEHNINNGSWIQVRMLNGCSVEAAQGKYPQVSITFLPVTCMHCNNASCIKACPADAIYKREDGITVIDPAKCNGCQSCLEACPYHVILRDEQTGIASKCDLCRERIQGGLQPFCVDCCQTEAIHFGDVSESGGKLAEIIKRRSGFILNPEAHTEPATYYLPPFTKHPI